MGTEVKGMEISGGTLESGRSINSLTEVVRHWDYRVNIEEEVSIPQSIRFWRDQIDNRSLSRQGATPGTGLKIFSDGVGDNAGGGATLLNGGIGLNILSDQSPMSVHMVLRKTTVSSDSAEIQFGKLVPAGAVVHALFVATRAGAVRVRYTANVAGPSYPNNQYILASWCHYGGGGANNLKMFANGNSTVVSTGGPNSGGTLFLRGQNGNGIDWRVKKIIVVDHVGLTPTQIDNWRANTLIPLLLADSEYTSIVT